ncbi:hypothetical protein BVG80_09990 [Sphingobacteriales bacterium TSM_CSM]|nr:hypothetical protein BVG80_09990 [Sphingobacteriales bacterium TSM_CSM]
MQKTYNNIPLGCFFSFIHTIYLFIQSGIMKNLAAFLVVGCLLVFSVQKLQAQSQYEAQFANPQINCLEGTFCINLQLRAATGQPDFAIGAHTLFFSYNSNAINNPVYTSIHFNNTDSCALGGFMAPYFAPSYSFDPSTGEFNLTTNMLLPNQGCPLITADWIDVGTVCFQIIGSGQTTQLQYNTTLTLINLNDNTPQHTQGILFPLDITLDCSAFTDTDTDGLTDAEETTLGTNPNFPDSDFDGLSDGQEVNALLTDPLNPDTDTDGLTDGDEVNNYLINPLLPDTDADGLTDFDETDFYLTNPLLPDTDADGLSDSAELLQHFTDPLLPDTDADEVTDGEELNTYGTNPLDTDTDMDLLTDGEEVNTYNSNPLNPDTDSDGLTDGNEVQLFGTNLLLPDTDADGINDGNELNLYDTNPLNPDTDNDTLNDGLEISLAMNALSADSDEDNVPDNTEVPEGVALDTDSDEIINALDTDDDNDTILTINEDHNNNGQPADDDTDNDSLPDYLDNDDDGDGILTINEDANQNGILTDDDFNSNGIPDYLDPLAPAAIVTHHTLPATLGVYPNPSADMLNIQLPAAIQSYNNRLELLNAAGESLGSSNLTQGQTTTTVALQNIPAGVYFIRLWVENRLYGAARFVKR